MSYIEPPSLPTLPDLSTGSDVITGFSLAVTFLIFGLIFFTEFGTFIILYVFGNPVFTAYQAGGKVIIEHFNTPKSGLFKYARVSGDAFQYHDIRDGTVAASSKSVLGIGNKQLVMTYGNFGATIPIDVLAGVSVLVRQGIKNYSDLNERKKQLQNDELLLSGYDFDNFNNLLEESKKDKLIPLTIEAAPEFVEKNTNSDYNEAILSYSKAAFKTLTHDKFEDNSLAKLGSIVFMIIVLMLLQTVIK